MTVRQTEPRGPTTEEKVPANVGTVNNLPVALRLAAQGLAVLPLHTADPNGRCSCGKNCGRAAGKHPVGFLVRNGVDDATTDPARIRRWWRRARWANVGIALDGSDLVLLDIDPRHGGTLTDFLADYGAASGETLHVVTPNGGDHLYFRMNGTPIPAGVWRLRPGIEVHTAGYAIVPGSQRHGKVYEPDRTRPLRLADLPAGKLTADIRAAYNVRPSGHTKKSTSSLRINAARIARLTLTGDPALVTFLTDAAGMNVVADARSSKRRIVAFDPSVAAYTVFWLTRALKRIGVRLTRASTTTPMPPTVTNLPVTLDTLADVLAMPRLSTLQVLTLETGNRWQPYDATGDDTRSGVFQTTIRAFRAAGYTRRETLAALADTRHHGGVRLRNDWDREWRKAGAWLRDHPRERKKVAALTALRHRLACCRATADALLIGAGLRGVTRASARAALSSFLAKCRQLDRVEIDYSLRDWKADARLAGLDTIRRARDRLIRVGAIRRLSKGTRDGEAGRYRLSDSWHTKARDNFSARLSRTVSPCVPIVARNSGRGHLQALQPRPPYPSRPSRPPIPSGNSLGTDRSGNVPLRSPSPRPQRFTTLGATDIGGDLAYRGKCRNRAKTLGPTACDVYDMLNVPRTLPELLTRMSGCERTLRSALQRLQQHHLVEAITKSNHYRGRPPKVWRRTARTLEEVEREAGAVQFGDGKRARIIEDRATNPFQRVREARVYRALGVSSSPGDTRIPPNPDSPLFTPAFADV